MKINYENYGLEELKSALNSIDKEKYPENYANLVAEIRKRNSEVLVDETKLEKNSWRVDWKNNPSAGFEPLQKIKKGYAIVWASIASLFAFVGLITGHLWIPGKNNGISLEGTWARIVSGLILLVFVYVAYKSTTKSE